MSIFEELKNTKVADVKAPPKLPTGHYTAQITGMWKEKKAKSGNTGLEYPFQLREAGEDVDLEALSALEGGLPTDKNYSITWWMSPEARFHFTDFIKSVGISEDLDLLAAAQELGESMPMFTVEVRHEPVIDQTTKQPRMDEKTGEPITRIVFDNAVGLG